jgi:hypothetical protein
MRVYKFLSAKFALENIEKRRLKTSEFTDMNDPYELSGVDLANPKIADILLPFLQTKGVLCFSRNYSNPLLWSHYGDKHKGMCLGFDVNTDVVEVRKPFYVEHRQRLGNVCTAWRDYLAGRRQEYEEIIEKILLTKFQAWDYEDEVRVFLELANQDGPYYFCTFDENIRLVQVIIGFRCDATRNTIEEKLRGYPDHIEIIQAKLSLDSFEIVAAT